MAIWGMYIVYANRKPLKRHFSEPYYILSYYAIWIADIHTG